MIMPFVASWSTWPATILPIFIILAIMALSVAILWFEIVMFVSAIKNPYVPDNMRIFWLVGMLLFHPFVAIIYYFTEYQKTK